MIQARYCKKCEGYTAHGCFKCKEKQHQAEIEKIFKTIERIDKIHIEFAPKKPLTTNPAYLLFKKQKQEGK